MGPRKGEKLKTQVFLVVCRHQQLGQGRIGFFCSFCPCLFGRYLRDCEVYHQGTLHWKTPLPAVTSDFWSCLQEGGAFVNGQDGTPSIVQLAEERVP